MGNSFFILWTMNKVVKTFLVSLSFLCSFAFADDVPNAVPSEVNAAEMKAELDLRDSVMAARDNACRAESDSLRTVISVEQAKSANWEQSYNTVKKDYADLEKDNSVCQQALLVSINAQTEKKNSKESQAEAAMMSGSALLGGIGLGMLLFWLIFD